MSRVAHRRAHFSKHWKPETLFFPSLGRFRHQLFQALEKVSGSVSNPWKNPRPDERAAHAHAIHNATLTGLLERAAENISPLPRWQNSVLAERFRHTKPHNNSTSADSALRGRGFQPREPNQNRLHTHQEKPHPKMALEIFTAPLQGRAHGYCQRIGTLLRSRAETT